MVFIWGAGILYYPVSFGVRIYLRKELMPRFIKASSIQVSFVLVIIFACVIFGVVIANLPLESANKLSEAIENRPMYFQTSSIVLLTDLDKLTTFLDSISSFALANAATSFFIVGLVFRIITFASMLYGFIGTLAFCMLSRKEVASVFQLLPAFNKNEQLDENQSMLIRYFVAPLIIWLVVISGLGYAELKTEETLQATGTTPISQFVDNQLKVVVQTIEWAEDMNVLADKFNNDKKELVGKYENKLNNLLIEYYDSCEDDIDSYLDWYYGLAGQVTNALKFIPLARDRALDEFNSLVAEGNSTKVVRSKFKHQYDNYQTQMNQIIEEFNQKAEDLSSEQLPLPSIPSISFSIKDLISPDKTLSLWPTLNSGNDNDKKDIASKILPSDSSDREAFKQKLIELIGEEKQRSLETLNAQFDIVPDVS